VSSFMCGRYCRLHTEDRQEKFPEADLKARGAHKADLKVRPTPWELGARMADLNVRPSPWGAGRM